MDWDRDKHSGLSWRMARRVKVAVRDKAMPLGRIKRVALGYTGDRPNSYLPKWMQELSLGGYHDTWTDWQPEELRVIGDRLEQGVNSEDLQRLFRVPDKFFNTLQRRREKRTDKVLPGDPDSLEEFTEYDISSTKLRSQANVRWMEFAAELDVSTPVNRQTVRRLVILELQMRECERGLLDPKTTPQESKLLNAQYSELGSQYSKAAEDVSQLEKQREDRDQAQTLSVLVERAGKVSRDWKRNKTQIHMLMEESTLIDNMVMLHKVDMTVKTDGLQREGNINKRKTPMPVGGIISADMKDKPGEGIEITSSA
jgi:hypothetical protein